MIPVFGIVFDSVNTVWYWVDGEYGLALLSGTAIIHVIGEGTAATKISGKVTWKAMSYVDDAEIYVAKYGDDVSDILRTGAFSSSSNYTGNGLGKLAGKELNVSEKGLNIVKNHIDQFDYYQKEKP